MTNLLKNLYFILFAALIPTLGFAESPTDRAIRLLQEIQGKIPPGTKATVTVSIDEEEEETDDTSSNNGTSGFGGSSTGGSTATGAGGGAGGGGALSAIGSMAQYVASFSPFGMLGTATAVVQYAGLLGGGIAAVMAVNTFGLKKTLFGFATFVVGLYLAPEVMLVGALTAAGIWKPEAAKNAVYTVAATGFSGARAGIRVLHSWWRTAPPVAVPEGVVPAAAVRIAEAAS